MKNWKKIALFTGILMAFLFLSHQRAETVSTIQMELPGQYSEEGLHALAFIQPETTHQSISQNHTTAFSIVKWMGNFESISLHFVKSKIGKSFFTQDIDRCESVSLLLFPYHIFW